MKTVIALLAITLLSCSAAQNKTAAADAIAVADMACALAPAAAGLAGGNPAAVELACTTEKGVAATIKNVVGLRVKVTTPDGGSEDVVVPIAAAARTAPCPSSK